MLPEFLVLLGAQLLPTPTTREQALRPQQHHRHEREAVQQELVLDEVDLGESVATMGRVPMYRRRC